MFGVYTLSGKGYVPLRTDEDADERLPKRSRSAWAVVLEWSFMILALCGIGGLGFFAGQRSTTEQRGLQCKYETPEG